MDGMPIGPGDDIQVFVKGTGCCLWGRIQPESRYVKNSGQFGGIILELTIEPLNSTAYMLRHAGVVFRDGFTRPLLGKKVRIPQRLVDVVFGEYDMHQAFGD